MIMFVYTCMSINLLILIVKLHLMQQSHVVIQSNVSTIKIQHVKFYTLNVEEFNINGMYIIIFL